MAWFSLVTAMACMKMHAIQIGEIEAQSVRDGERFEIKLGALGFSAGELGDLASLAARSKQDRDAIGLITAIIELTQQGPRTGEPVFDPRFADRLHREILDRCPSGDISGLMTVRESGDYTGITGEIVKVVGFCGGGQ